MIKSSLLPQIRGFIGGEWADSRSGDRSNVTNPATGELLAEVPAMGGEECEAAADAAMGALKTQPSVEQRRDWLIEMGKQLLARKSEFAEVITLEQGKPLREAVAEVEYSAGFFNFFAGALDELKPKDLPTRSRGFRWSIQLRAAGVAGAITPWNFPLAMIAKKLSAAVGAGCSVVLKPASATPLSAIALCTITRQIGMPAGLVNLVTGKGGPIAKALCRHPAVRIISFTGSTEVGKELANQAAPYLKRVTLELGGNAPFIVFDDADLSAAVDALVANKFRAGGQTCVCANRVFVHRGVNDAFVAKLAHRLESLKVGNGLDDATDIGPLINQDGFDKVASHVRDAMEHGAKRVVGGDPPRPAEDWGCFYPPTLLTDVRPEMRVSREETFGPVVAIAGFSSDDEVIEAANSTPYGLAAYIFSSDRSRQERIVASLQFGHVAVNSGTGPTPEAPFGGMKQSGYGREGGVEGLLEFCEQQTVVHG